jgi:hypothetical protein
MIYEKRVVLVENKCQFSKTMENLCIFMEDKKSLPLFWNI